MKLPKLNQKGFGLHAILPVLVILVVSVIGVHLLTASHAAVVTGGGGGYTNGKIYYAGIVRNPDGSGQKLTDLSSSSANLSNMSFDGTQVAYWGSDPNSPSTLYRGTITNTGAIANVSTIASLPSGTGPDAPPVWSPDGTKVADKVSNLSGQKIWVANTNGTGGHFVANVPKYIGSYIAWRPLSENIVYTPYAGDSGPLSAKNSEICTTSIGGVDYGCHPILLGSLAPASALGQGGVSVSPDGGKVALVTFNNFISAHPPTSADIYVVNSKGGGLTRLTSFAKGEVVMNAVWSPDGTKIAYLLDAANSKTPSATGIYVMNTDGSGKTQIVNPSSLGILGLDLALQNVTLSWAHK